MRDALSVVFAQQLQPPCTRYQRLVAVLPMTRLVPGFGNTSKTASRLLSAPLLAINADEGRPTSVYNKLDQDPLPGKPDDAAGPEPASSGRTLQGTQGTDDGAGDAGATMNDDAGAGGTEGDTGAVGATGGAGGADGTAGGTDDPDMGDGDGMGAGTDSGDDGAFDGSDGSDGFSDLYDSFDFDSSSSEDDFDGDFLGGNMDLGLDLDQTAEDEPVTPISTLIMMPCTQRWLGLRNRDDMANVLRTPCLAHARNRVLWVQVPPVFISHADNFPRRTVTGA